MDEGDGLTVVIKCSGASRAVREGRFAAACAFTVRWHHRLVYKAGGVAFPGAPANVWTESLRRAFAWLLEHGRPGRVVVRVDGPYCPAEIGSALALLCARGWEIALQRVAPEYVSEAAAIASRLLGALCRRPKRSVITWDEPPVRRWRPKQRTAVPPVPPAEKPVDRPANHLTIICDGGYQPLGGAGGLAAYAFLARQRSDLIHSEKGVVCHGPAAGSQMAELGALVASLRWLAASPLAIGARVHLHSDCQGVVHAVTGRCRIRLRRGSVMLIRTAARLLRRLQRCRCKVSISHLPRKRVAEADKLCRRVYAEQLSARPPRRSVKAFLRSS